jgi:hypothetical protein
VLHESTPELFRTHLREALDLVKPRDPEQRLIFLKSWNEWAEGNYLEPDQKFGRDYLKVVGEELGYRGMEAEEHRRERAPVIPWRNHA